MAAANDAEKIFERVKDAVEGTAGKRGLFELVRPHEARRGLQGRRPDLGPDRFPAVVDQRPLSRPDRRALEAGGARTAADRDHRAQRDAAGASDDRGRAGAARASRSGRRRPRSARAPSPTARPSASPAPRTGGAAGAEFRQGVLGSPLDPRYTFDSFVEGPSNRVALAAAAAVAESMSRFNPLFLHATVGLGKTHLLQAIAAESLQAESEVARRLSDGGIFHVALRHRDPRQQRADPEGAVARHRPSDHRRHAVPAGQVDPARVLPSDQHAARQRQAGGGGRRPAAGGAGIAGAARALAAQRRRGARNVGARLRNAPRHAEAPPRRGQGRGSVASISPRTSSTMSPAR